ncbi:MAG: Hsp20/alpha crystallin family protein [Crocinitomicaceae bacterium]|nr:Hsp20/alpha crystallin family protein [Crocinitomicaceae bacterium]
MTLLKKRANGSKIPSIRSNLLDLFEANPFVEESLFTQPLKMWNEASTRIPATNIRETKEEYTVEIAAPGMEKEDFHVDIVNNMLEITVEKETVNEEEEKEYTRREYDYRSFNRSFNLPETVDAEKVKADYKNGILRVHLPKIAIPEKDIREITIE